MYYHMIEMNSSTNVFMIYKFNIFAIIDDVIFLIFIYKYYVYIHKYIYYVYIHIN